MNSLTEQNLELPKSHDWGVLALELLLGGQDAGMICMAYHTSPEAVAHALEHNRAFVAAFKDARQAIKAAGPNAGFVLRAKTLAERNLTTMQNIIDDTKAPHAVRVAAIEKIAKWAGLEPKESAQVGNAVQVNIQLDPAAVTKKVTLNG